LDELLKNGIVSCYNQIDFAIQAKPNQLHKQELVDKYVLERLKADSSQQ